MANSGEWGALFESADIATDDHRYPSSGGHEQQLAEAARLLDAVVEDTAWSSNDLLAVSRPKLALLCISRTGHVLVVEKGLFTKRTEIKERVSYENVTELVRYEKGVRGRDGSVLEGRDASGAKLFALTWVGIGGPEPESSERHRRAIDERDRVFGIVAAIVGAV